MVEGPGWWRDKVVRQEVTKIDNTFLPTYPWNSSSENGYRLRSLWVRIQGFPRKHWSRGEFVRLVEGFGVLLEIDPATIDRSDLVEARIRIGVCKIEDVPTMKQVVFRNDREEYCWYPVRFLFNRSAGPKKDNGKRRKTGMKGDRDASSSQPPGDENGDNPRDAANDEDDPMNEEFEEEPDYEPDLNAAEQQDVMPQTVDAGDLIPDLTKDSEATVTDIATVSLQELSDIGTEPLNSIDSRAIVTDKENQASVTSQEMVAIEPGAITIIDNPAPLAQLPPITKQSLRPKLLNPENSALDKAVSQKYKSINMITSEGEQWASLSDDFWPDSSKISDLNDSALTAPFQMTEIKEALFTSDGGKASGPDDPTMMQVIKWAFIGFEAVSEAWKEDMKEKLHL